MISNIEKTERHIRVTIGRNIQGLRDDARMSRRELASCMGISYQQLYKYEKGQNNITAEQMVYLKFYLQAPYEEFFRGLF